MDIQYPINILFEIKKIKIVKLKWKKQKQMSRYRFSTLRLSPASRRLPALFPDSDAAIRGFHLGALALYQWLINRNCSFQPFLSAFLPRSNYCRLCHHCRRRHLSVRSLSPAQGKFWLLKLISYLIYIWLWLILLPNLFLACLSCSLFVCGSRLVAFKL